MGLGKKALKTVGWVKAPRLMFARRHPRKAALLAATGWITNRVLPGRRRRRASFARTAAQGLGAAVVAIPVGVWVGRKVWGGSSEQPAGAAQP